MQTSHHTLYPATAELHRHNRQHQLPEIERLAAHVREAEAKPLQKALAPANSQLEQPVSGNE